MNLEQYHQIKEVLEAPSIGATVVPTLKEGESLESAENIWVFEATVDRQRISTAQVIAALATAGYFTEDKEKDRLALQRGELRVFLRYGRETGSVGGKRTLGIEDVASPANNVDVYHKPAETVAA